MLERVLFYSTEFAECRSPLSFDGVVAIVFSFCVVGLLWAAANVRKVTSINLEHDDIIDMDDGESMQYDLVSPSQKKLLLELGEKIADVRS
jgi:hypothetical protein